MKGDRLVRNMSYLFYDSNCTTNLLSDGDSYNKSMNVTFNGTGSYDQCQSLVGRAMDFSSCVINDASCVGGAYRAPNVTGDFLVRYSITLWTIGYYWDMVCCRGFPHSTTRASTLTPPTLTTPHYHTLSPVSQDIAAKEQLRLAHDILLYLTSSLSLSLSLAISILFLW